MKRKHTQSKKANRKFLKGLNTIGMSPQRAYMLFSRKPNSQTSKLRRSGLLKPKF